MDKSQYVLQLEQKIDRLEAQLDGQFSAECAIDETPVPMLSVDSAYTLKYANQAFGDLVGVQKKDVMNERLDTIFGRKKYFRCFKGFIDQSFKGVVTSHLCLISKAQGVKENMHLEYLPFYMGCASVRRILILFKDIDDPKSDTDIPAGYSELIDILNAFGEILFVTNENFEITFMNLQGRETFGLKNREIAGKKCYNLLLGKDTPPDECPFKSNGQNRQHSSLKVHNIYAVEGYAIKAYPLCFNYGSHFSILHQMVPASEADKECLGMDDLVVSAIDQKIHQELYRFRKRLSTKYPNLTSHNLTHCALIRMNMSTGEIARYFHVNPTTIQRARVRLKKKMNLSREDDLIKFLMNF